MNIPDKKVITFLKKHHVLTLATTVDDQPWCANCFYAFIEAEMTLVFTSGMETRHAGEAVKNPKVAGSIVLETNVIGKIQGIQLSGDLHLPDSDVADQVKSVYLKRFPFAALMDTTIWALRIDYLKLTDNRLGFGKKLIWSRN